jgi:UDP-MurNAc hydroxylase
MDPWLSGRGAFLHTWFPYPDNTALKERVLRYLEGRDLYVYISHQHEDHCDVDFLRELGGLDPIYVLPAFADASLTRRMAPLQGRRIYLADGEHLTIGDDTVLTVFTDEGGINTDSAILLRSGGRSFLNLNDCKIFDRLGTLITAPVDVLTCQFSGATWHPTCYEYDEAKYRSISAKKRNSKYYQVYRAIAAIKPSVYIPAAGPAAFLHPALYHKNFEEVNIFPKAEEFRRYLATRPLASEIRIMRPGQTLGLDGRSTAPLFPIDVDDDLEAYRRSKEHLFFDARPVDPEAAFEALALMVQEKVERFRTRLKSKFTVLLGVIGSQRRIRIDLGERCCTIVHDHAATSPLYSIEAYPEAVAALVGGRIEWDNFCLTFLFRIRREPDEYCPLVNLFLFSSTENLPEALRNLELFQSDESRIEISASGYRFTCQRRCPHQGADLAFGHAEDHFWVCPRHRWRFDLSRGGIAENGSCSIGARRIDDVVPTTQAAAGSRELTFRKA